MFDDLIKLINAGFTHDEIMQLTSGAPAAPEAPQEASPAEDQPTESVQEEAPERTPETVPEEAPEGMDYITTLRSEINDLRKMIQKNNVMTAEQQSSRTTQKTDTDIIANIIKGG